ncbi:MAG: Rv3654c family TadE-like protein [Nocardioides sp.]
MSGSLVPTKVPAERGAAAVLVCCCLAILVTVAVGLGAVAGLVAAHRRAQAAADLAALAGARSGQLGADACGSAAAVAGENLGVVIRCQVRAGTVTVDVRVSGPLWFGRRVDPVATARAGPG